jgi:hypothetical protein
MISEISDNHKDIMQTIIFLSKKISILLQLIKSLIIIKY